MAASNDPVQKQTERLLRPYEEVDTGEEPIYYEADSDADEVSEHNSDSEQELEMSMKEMSKKKRCLYRKRGDEMEKCMSSQKCA